MNGSSEMVTNLSTSLVNILYNFQLMKLAGADGVAAFGVIMYVNFYLRCGRYGIFGRKRSDCKLSLRSGE